MLGGRKSRGGRDMILFGVMLCRCSCVACVLVGSDTSIEAPFAYARACVVTFEILVIRPCPWGTCLSSVRVGTSLMLARLCFVGFVITVELASSTQS